MLDSEYHSVPPITDNNLVKYDPRYCPLSVLKRFIESQKNIIHSGVQLSLYNEYCKLYEERLEARPKVDSAAC